MAIKLVVGFHYQPSIRLSYFSKFSTVSNSRLSDQLKIILRRSSFSQAYFFLVNSFFFLLLYSRQSVALFRLRCKDYQSICLAFIIQTHKRVESAYNYKSYKNQIGPKMDYRCYICTGIAENSLFSLDRFQMFCAFRG